MDIAGLAESYVHAWASHDAAALAALHSSDTVFEVHGALVPPAEGRDAVELLVTGLFALSPDIRFENQRVYAGPDHLVVEFVMTGTRGGADFECDAVDVLGFRDGLVVRNDIYFDTAKYRSQVGAAI